MVRRCGTYELSRSAPTHPLKDLVGPRSRPRSGPASGSCRSRTCHRFQAFYRWVCTCTPSGFGFKQSSFTPRRRVLRTPCSTTLSSMRRFPGMLGHHQFSPPALPVTQEPLLSSSCLQQGYHNAPHGAHRTCSFHRIRLSRTVVVTLAGRSSSPDGWRSRHSLIQNHSWTVPSAALLVRMFAAAHTLSRSWRTFTRSWFLPPGIWLLRRLRPLGCTLACLRPIAG